MSAPLFLPLIQSPRGWARLRTARVVSDDLLERMRAHWAAAQGDSLPLAAAATDHLPPASVDLMGPYHKAAARRWTKNDRDILGRLLDALTPANSPSTHRAPHGSATGALVSYRCTVVPPKWSTGPLPIARASEHVPWQVEVLPEDAWRGDPNDSATWLAPELVAAMRSVDRRDPVSLLEAWALRTIVVEAAQSPKDTIERAKTWDCALGHRRGYWSRTTTNHALTALGDITPVRTDGLKMARDVRAWMAAVQAVPVTQFSDPVERLRTGTAVVVFLPKGGLLTAHGGSTDALTNARLFADEAEARRALRSTAIVQGASRRGEGAPTLVRVAVSVLGYVPGESASAAQSDLAAVMASVERDELRRTAVGASHNAPIADGPPSDTNSTTSGGGRRRM